MCSSKSDHRPWCVEHDPTGTCLGELRRLPGGGAAWLESATTTKIVVALGRSGRRHVCELDPSGARRLAVVIGELASQIEHEKLAQGRTGV